jgi:ABC-type phosphate transport system substrate-binding protein
MLLSDRRYPSPAGVFLDRKLKRKEKRYLKVQLDLGRDADVLIATRGHPACATGVSRSVAKGIAAGTIRTWSAAGVPAPAGGNAIALRRAGTGSDRFVEPRLGAGYKLPSGARKTYDGGLAEAASGNTSIAGVTSWSRARSFQSSTCAIPVGGSAPTDASVRALTHPNAYPISFVTLKRLKDARPLVAAFVKYLAGSRAADSFRGRGMLPAKGEWPFVPTS